MKKFHPISPMDLKETWPIIRYGLLRAVPPSAGGGLDTMQQLLVRLLSSKAQAWLLYDEEKVYSVALTYIDSDAMTGKKYVLLYAWYNYERITEEDWQFVLAGVELYARENGAGRLLAFTQVPRMVEIASKLGFNSNFTLIAKELTDG